MPKIKINCKVAASAEEMLDLIELTRWEELDEAGTTAKVQEMMKIMSRLYQHGFEDAMNNINPN